MSWKDLFKDYPKGWTKYAMMGIIESLKVLLLFGKFMDKDELIGTMEKTLKSVQKDLEELKNEEGTL